MGENKFFCENICTQTISSKMCALHYPTNRLQYTFRRQSSGKLIVNHCNRHWDFGNRQLGLISGS